VAPTRVSRRGTSVPCSGCSTSTPSGTRPSNVTYWPGGAFVGTQAVVDGVLARIPQDFDGFAIDIGRIVGCGDTVLVEARYRATAKATGKALDAQVAHIWDFRDGKLVHWQQYTDTWQFAEVTGVTPALARA
jgi:ketosteroid isomerase-like protein